MSVPNETPPLGGSAQDQVDYSIRRGQQETNIAEVRDKDLNVQGAFTITGQLVIPPITTDILTATVNDYVIPGIGSARSSVVRLSSDAAWDISGIKAMPNEFLWLINVGTFTIRLFHNSTASEAANQISNYTGIPWSILVGKASCLWYDSVSSVWRVLS